MRKTLPILTAILLIASTTTAAEAQFGASLRGSGLAGAYAGLALGHEALDWNPALLGLDSGPIVSLGLPRFNMAGTVLGPSWFDLLDILADPDDLTDASRLDFLDKVPADGLELRGDVHLPWAGLSMGPLAASVSTTFLASGTVGQEFMDLLLYTRQYGEVDPTRLAEYRVGNTTGRQALFTTFKVGYGQSLNDALPLPFPVSVGVTARYVRGHSLARSRLFEPQVDLANQDITIAALAINAPRGTGYGLDVGVAARPIPGLTVSMAIDNIARKMT